MNVVYVDFRAPRKVKQLSAAGWFFLSYAALFVAVLAWWLK